MPRITRHGKSFIKPAASISKQRMSPSSALNRSLVSPSLMTWFPEAIVPKCNDTLASSRGVLFTNCSLLHSLQEEPPAWVYVDSYRESRSAPWYANSRRRENAERYSGSFARPPMWIDRSLASAVRRIVGGAFKLPVLRKCPSASVFPKSYWTTQTFVESSVLELLPFLQWSPIASQMI